MKAKYTMGQKVTILGSKKMEGLTGTITKIYLRHPLAYDIRLDQPHNGIIEITRIEQLLTTSNTETMNPQITIIDQLLTDKKILKKINWISCLQAHSDNESKYPYFFGSVYEKRELSIIRVDKIQRVAEITIDNKLVSVVVVSFKDEAEDNVWLADWNDGIL